MSHSDTELLGELLQGEAWVGTGALFQRSSFESKDQFNEWLQRLKHQGMAQIRTGAFGLEAGLAGTPEPSMARADAKAPTAPAGAGPAPPALTAPASLLEAPQRISGKQIEHVDAPPRFVLPAAENAGRLRTPPKLMTLSEARAEFGPQPESEEKADVSHGKRDETELPSLQSAPAARVEDSSMPKTKAKARGAKPTGDKRDVVLGLLRQSPWKTGELIKASGMERAQLYPLLRALQKEGLATLEGTARAATWSATGSGKPGAIAAADQARRAAKGKSGKTAKADGPQTITKALDELELRFRPHRVERLDLKLKVLLRLEQIFDPTIGAVLAEIRADLAPAV